MTPARPGAAFIDRICLTVPDLGRAEGFYGEALGFACVQRTARCERDRAHLIGLPGATIASTTLRLGEQTIELLAFDPPGRAYPEGSTSSDLWFQHCAVVVRDMAQASDRLRRCRVEAITQDGPQMLPPSTGAVTAYKFRDPFGHPLELLHFPLGVGDPVWQAPSAGNCLGIDHTAIAVSDADASARFYADTLGFRLASRGQNTGPEQDRLDALNADRVDVLALSPARQPPHLELLGYRTGLRRPRPRDWTPADIAATRTVIVVEDLADAVRRFGAALPSGRVRSGRWDGRAAAVAEDLDGHLILLLAGP